jgi:hypothetical protein
MPSKSKSPVTSQPSEIRAEPSESGTTGEQSPAMSGEVLPPGATPPKDGALSSHAIPEAFDFLAKLHPQKIGGLVAANLATAFIKSSWDEINTLRQQVERKDGKLDDLQTENTNLKIENAALTERLNAETAASTPKKLQITVGMAFIGLGIKFVDNESTRPLAIAVFLGGLALTLAGWLPRRRGGK